MSKKPVSRLMALVLSAALVFTMMPFTVSVKAAGCTHKHDAECGYVEGRYVTDDDPEDSDIEDDELEDVELENDYVEGVPATSSNMEGHYVEGAPCQHEHDETCGGLTDSGKMPGKSGEESELVVVAEFDELDEDTLYQGYDYGEITSQDDLILPDTLTGLDANDNSITIEGVIWQSDPEFDPAVSIVYPGYIFSIVLPEGYALAEGATAPVISVIIRPEDGMPINPTAGADALVSTINTYSANNKGSNQGFTATASEDGKTVTVTDNTGVTGNPGVTGATNQLALAIDSGVTVVWKATLSGSGVTLISLSGTGTFEVASGGTITSGWGAINTSGKLEISGGTVISTAGATMQAPTIRAGNGSVVTVKSGAVTSTNYLGINVVSGAVAILQGGAVNGAHSEYNAAIGNSGKLYYLGNTSGNNGIYITANGTAYYIGGNSVAARFTNNSGGNLIAFDEPTVTDSSGTHNGNNPAASYVTASFPPQLDLSGANISIIPAGTPYTQVGNNIRFTADMNENVTVVVNGATITELDNMTLDTFTASFKVYIDGLGENVSNNITFENKTVTYGDTYTMTATFDGNTSGFSYTYVGIDGTTYPSSANAPTNAGTYEVTATYSGTNNETGIAMATLYILRKPITGAEVTCSTAFTYNGEYPAVIGNVTVKLNGTPLTNSNWEFSYIPLGATPGNYGFTIVGRGNYDGEATGVYTVIPKPITISNVTATDRDYDGTATVVLSGGMLSGVISGDSANVGFTLGSGTLQDKNAGTNKSVNASITLTGSAAGNYTLTLPTVTVNISPKSVTITGLTAGNKVYDGSTAATVNGTAALSANYDGANLTISEGTAAFDNANAGTGKPVTFSGYSLGGMAAGNYTLSAQPASVTADITKKELTITGFDITKVYDGSTSISSLGTLTFSGLVSPETADVDTSGVTATYAAATVGTHNITFSSNFGMTGGTAAAGNYTITQPTNITGKITKTFQATLTIDDPGTKTYSSGGTFQLSTQGGNGSGAVTYTITSGTDVISITGSTVTILKVGTATVTATKVGDNDYEPTTSAPITITVNKATGSFGTVAARNATYTPTLTLADVALPSGYVWNLPGTSLSTGDNQSFAATYTLNFLIFSH